MKTPLSFLFLIVSFKVLAQADSTRLKNHVFEITNTDKHRNYQNLEALNHVAQYIFNQLKPYCDTVFYQSYWVHGKEYKNVVAQIYNTNKSTIVIGAHYDVCNDQDGADDNASGVAGLLEFARNVDQNKVNYTIELVAYTLEEPPFFRTQQMGSFIHAESLHNKNTEVYGMVCLEMIGYFDDAKKSQDYPLGFLSLFYGTKGNFITLVNKYGMGKFARKFSKSYKKNATIRTKEFAGPAKLPGIDFSDHLNYWAFGFSATMITDTAFYRNKNYHEEGDTIDKLNFQKMALVIDSLLNAIYSLG